MSEQFGQFNYRWNSNHTVDSICTYCFMTAGTARNKAELRAKEMSHKCPKEATNVLPSLNGVSRKSVSAE